MIAAEALVGLLSLVLLLVLFYGPVQGAITDYARQVMFEKRDALFDLAAEGRLDFRSREYKEIRTSLEATIRFAHQATLPRLLVEYVGLKAAGRELPSTSTLTRSMGQIADVGTRNAVKKLVDQSHQALVIMIILRSMLFWLLVIPMLLAVLLLALLDKRRRVSRSIVRGAGEYVQVEAENAPWPIPHVRRAA